MQFIRQQQSKKVDYQTILNFWFEQITPEMWWQKNADFDRLIGQKFAVLHQKAVQGELFQWRLVAEGRLAEILLLDQFSRNIYRGQALAFAADPMALALAQEAVAAGADKQVSLQRRSFFYMPYMHSESLLIHQVAEQLYRQAGLESQLDFELKHKAIIEAFGRYPHRNQILGRASTEAELSYLQQPDAGF